MIEFNATFLVSIISFVLFIMIMNAIFYNPILNIIKKREDYINSNYKESESIVGEAENLEQTYRNQYEKAKSSSRKILNSEVEKFQKEIDGKVSTAKLQARNSIKLQKEDLQKNAQEMKKSIDNTTIEELTNIISSKILEVE